MYKHEKAQEKVNLVDMIIAERTRLRLETPEPMEIDLWGRPRAELEAMLNELKLKR
jgi:hypothetical protein